MLKEIKGVTGIPNTRKFINYSVLVPIAETPNKGLIDKYFKKIRR